MAVTCVGASQPLIGFVKGLLGGPAANQDAPNGRSDLDRLDEGRTALGTPSRPCLAELLVIVGMVSHYLAALGDRPAQQKLVELNGRRRGSQPA